MSTDSDTQMISDSQGGEPMHVDSSDDDEKFFSAGEDESVQPLHDVSLSRRGFALPETLVRSAGASQTKDYKGEVERTIDEYKGVIEESIKSMFNQQRQQFQAFQEEKMHELRAHQQEELLEQQNRLQLLREEVQALQEKQELEGRLLMLEKQKFFAMMEKQQAVAANTPMGLQNPQNAAVPTAQPTPSTSQVTQVDELPPRDANQAVSLEEVTHCGPEVSSHLSLNHDTPGEAVPTSITKHLHVRQPAMHASRCQSIEPSQPRGGSRLLQRGKLGGVEKVSRRPKRVQVASDSESVNEVEKELSTTVDFTDIIATKVTQKMTHMLGCTPNRDSLKSIKSTKASYKHGPTRAKKIKAEERENEDSEERKINIYQLRKYLFEKLRCESHSDFVMHTPASHEDITKFMTSHEGGPTLDDLRVDVDGGLRSDWNKRWFHLTRLDFLETMASEIYPRTDTYWTDLIKDQFNRLCVEWKKMQPKRNEDGALETISDTERRVNEQAARAEKSKRHASRQHNLYKRRLDYTRWRYNNAEEEDRAAWRFLSDLLVKLGPCGVSSDETDDQATTRAFKVKTLVWRRSMGDYMDMIDQGRDDPGFKSQAGSRASVRHRFPKAFEPKNLQSKRTPPKGLPTELYSEGWLATLEIYGYHQCESVLLHMGDDTVMFLVAVERGHRNEQTRDPHHAPEGGSRGANHIYKPKACGGSGGSVRHRGGAVRGFGDMSRRGAESHQLAIVLRTTSNRATGQPSSVDRECGHVRCGTDEWVRTMLPRPGIFLLPYPSLSSFSHSSITSLVVDLHGPVEQAALPDEMLVGLTGRGFGGAGDVERA
ncbi:hypothetical protein HWV62_18810 [Athelia sp. TMB]|nr:hypothetical protein HWV62_18810 [Athelia sp. TMB]